MKISVAAKGRIIQAMLAAWVAVWIFYAARDLFFKGRLAEYAALMPMDLEEKHAYITGGRLYEFISFANRTLPPGASFTFKGLTAGSLEYRKAVYYLYPHLESREADYILVYDTPMPPDGRYEKFAGLDSDRYILRRKGT